jgi:hypothetical protein
MKSILNDCPLKEMLDFFNSDEPEQIRKSALQKIEEKKQEKDLTIKTPTL